MSFDYTPKVQELRKQLIAFMSQQVYPNEHKWHEHVKSERRWETVPIIEELKASGAVSLRQIAAELNARGIRTARGGAWSAVQVKRVLERA